LLKGFFVKKAEMKYYKAKAKVTSVRPFPMGGAIAYYTCSCGMGGGQAIHGKPEDFQHIVGKSYMHSCPSSKHAEKGKAKPVEVETDGLGACDNCGADLKRAFRLGESTGCSIRCAKEDYQRDLKELERENE
jgi:hypothetical protein